MSIRISSTTESTLAAAGAFMPKSPNVNAGLSDAVAVSSVPARFAFTWEIDAAFKVDPTMKTRVEVTFTAEKGGTRVDLVHRGLRAYGEKAGEMVAIFDSPGGWTGLMAAFAAHASTSAA